MELHIGKWGNSLAVRLPTQLVKELGVSEGSIVKAEVLGERMLRLEACPKVRNIGSFVADLRALHKNMPMTQPIDKDDLGRY